MRNPLNGLIGCITLLKDDINTIHELFQNISEKIDVLVANKFHILFIKVKDYLKAIDNCSEQQKVIVDDVLDLSKLENMKATLEENIFNIKHVIDDVARMFNARLTEKNLKLNVELPKYNNDDELLFKSDKHRLTQVIINLLSNAIKFTEHGSINLNVSIKQQALQSSECVLKIYLEDTGIGMTQDEVRNLFNNYYQVKKTNGGTGLGLVISKKIVELMGGTITVNSKKWKGSKFIFTISCKRPSTEDVIAFKYQLNLTIYTSKKNDNTKPLTVLVVEDNIINQKILVTYLEKKGYFYQVADNGLIAIQKCENYKFDIIFMDIEMPVMNGLDATIHIRNNLHNINHNTPIIGLSGNANKIQIDEGYKAGMNDYLTKPYHIQDLYRIIENNVIMC